MSGRARRAAPAGGGAREIRSIQTSLPRRHTSLTELLVCPTIETMDRVMFTEQFWDERYRSRDHLWSGQPNQRLVEEVAGAAPGHALDVGCGEGGDAIWLARQGWTVTGVDVSSVALQRAAAHAAQDLP